MDFMVSNLHLAITGVIVLIIIAIVIVMSNAITKQKNLIKRAWADVITYQLRKLKVIPLIEKGVKEYEVFEGDTLQKIVELRNALRGLKHGEIDHVKFAAAEKASKKLMSSLNVTFERYPSLKTSELYKAYFKELSEAQENITAAITIFNGAVMEFNCFIQTFPGNIINAAFNKQKPVNEFTDEAASKEIEYKPNL
jgi:LemA protein